MKTFHLPDLGEGLPDGEIIKWHVKVGDEIKSDEPLVSIETAKAVVEVPSPYTGTITKLYGGEGDIIPTDSPLVDFELLSKEEKGTVAGEIKVGNEVLTERALPISKGAQGIKVLPAVRALAKKLNVDLTTIHPSGSEGTISFEDVKKASESLNEAGPLELLRGVRRTMAMVMTQSHAEVVPVTIMDDVDISAWAKEKDFTVRMILAIVKACSEEPSLNAWFDGNQMGRRLLSDVHVGIAMDTPEGLFVPVIQNAKTKSAAVLRDEIKILKEEVYERRISPEKLKGATIILSNFGNFAGRYANPIIVPPMVAILGAGVVRQEMLVSDAKPVIGDVLPLSLSFDHRAVTGGEATRFLAAIMRYLAQP